MLYVLQVDSICMLDIDVLIYLKVLHCKYLLLNIHHSIYNVCLYIMYITLFHFNK